MSEEPNFIVRPGEPTRDLRPIESLTLGIDSPDREGEAGWVRDILSHLGCKVGDDVRGLGCTGVASIAAIVDPVRVGKRLLIGLAGSGIGLTCFVPPSRFCLVHNTIGGLQDGQAPKWVENIPRISRELTPEERAKYALVERARRSESSSMSGAMREASDLLGGWKKKEAVKSVIEILTEEDGGIVEEFAAPSPAPPAASSSAPVASSSAPVESPGLLRLVAHAAQLEDEVKRLEAEAWKCQAHKKLDWKCRYCVAQAIVEGPLDLWYQTTVTDDDNLGAPWEGEGVQAHIEACAHMKRIDVFVRCATFTRKLSRD